MPPRSRVLSQLGAWVLAAALAATAGCQDDVTTVFPPGLEPLEDNRAPAPAGEELITVQGGDGLKWVHGRGRVLGPPGLVWAASKEPAHVVADCETSRHAVTVGVEPQYEFGFRVHYEVDDLLTVKWDELWRYGTIEGTPDAPTLAIIRYQKVYGSDFITTLQGSTILRAGDGADVTEVELIEQLDALGGNHDNIKRSMIQRFAIMVALAHGRPIPPCP